MLTSPPPRTSLLAIVLALVTATGCLASPALSPLPPSAIPTAGPSSTSTPSPSHSPGTPFGPSSKVQEALVTRVVDGDTIKVAYGGSEFTVRYIGIDTPETVKPGSPVEWMGPEASAANAELVFGRTVYLEKDVSETDRFGRLLRYVWLDDPTGWLMVNLALVQRGFAAASAYPPDVRYQDMLDQAQREARLAGNGLWAPSPGPTSGDGTSPSPASACDPSYPGVCIPPYPPDLDCGDITYRRFEVLPPDPHGFDGDHDGLGCEG